MTLHFDSDYMQGAHPRILERLATTNSTQFAGYGCDEVCDAARSKIRAACNAPQASVHFLVGGTQTNVIVLDQLLKPWQGVLVAQSGHVEVHEAGAVEFTGHKVLPLPEQGGKVAASSVIDYCETFFADANHEHMVEPGVLYISQPTEYGTLYSLAELKELRSACDRFGLRLYVDGARLAYALGCPANDVQLPDLAQLADAFYIGGTKCGALMGEAVVFSNPSLADHFFTQIKRHGGLLAKGWLLGLQFDELFEDDLYREIGVHAIKQADRIRAALAAKSYKPYIDSPTNQIFVVLDNDTAKRLRQEVTMGFWEKQDNTHSIMRFATSWATKPEDVDALIELL